MNDSALVQDLIREIWEEVDRRFRTDADALDPTLLSWLNILGILQHRVDSLDMRRTDCGLPAEDADTLFVRYIGG